jgi:hypothetical protein
LPRSVNACQFRTLKPCSRLGYLFPGDRCAPLELAHQNVVNPTATAKLPLAIETPRRTKTVVAFLEQGGRSAK